VSTKKGFVFMDNPGLNDRPRRPGAGGPGGANFSLPFHHRPRAQRVRPASRRRRSSSRPTRPEVQAQWKNDLDGPNSGQAPRILDVEETMQQCGQRPFRTLNAEDRLSGTARTKSDSF